MPGIERRGVEHQNRHLGLAAPVVLFGFEPLGASLWQNSELIEVKRPLSLAFGRRVFEDSGEQPNRARIALVDDRAQHREGISEHPHSNVPLHARKKIFAQALHDPDVDIADRRVVECLEIY
jgi:hypothetical protein